MVSSEVRVRRIRAACSSIGMGFHKFTQALPAVQETHHARRAPQRCPRKGESRIFAAARRASRCSATRQVFHF
jgi:hypothetical protein